MAGAPQITNFSGTDRVSVGYVSLLVRRLKLCSDGCTFPRNRLHASLIAGVLHSYTAKFGNRRGNRHEAQKAGRVARDAEP